MKLTLTNFILIVGIIIIGYFLLQTKCNGPGEPEIIRDTFYVFDTTWVYDTIDNTKYPAPKVITNTKWKYHDVDTGAILADYHATRVYNRTLVNDSNLTFNTIDSVSENKLLGNTGISYKINRPKQVITNNYYYGDKWKLSVGAFAGINLTPLDSSSTVLPSFIPTATFSYNKFEYSLGYDLPREMTLFGVQYTIFKNKTKKGLKY